MQVLRYKWSLRWYEVVGLEPGCVGKVLDLKLGYELTAVIPVLDLG